MTYIIIHDIVSYYNVNSIDKIKSILLCHLSFFGKITFLNISDEVVQGR